MNPIEYLQSLGWRITSDPTKYRDWYPDGPLSPWGYRKYWERHDGKIIYYDSYCNHYHRAYDLSIKEGAPVPAVVDGVIVDGTRQKGNFGGTVVLMDHKGDYQYICGHVKNIQVKVGDHVKRGQKLAEQSNTNYEGVPMNSHLHFQVQTAGWRAEKAFVCDGINPLNIDVNNYIGVKKVSKGRQRLGKKIGLDIGHGVNTFPSNGKGVYRGGRGYAEFSFNNKLAKRIKPLLEHNGFDVVMAQPFDSNDVALLRRTNYYDAQRCDLGLSLHANAGVASVGGRCAFYWHSSRQGKNFASSIIENMKAPGYRFHGIGLHESYFGSWTNLHMVRECTTFPMVLIEHGFMTNDLDFPLIFGNRQNQYIKDMAEADVKAVCDYFNVKFLDMDDSVEKSTGSKSGTTGSTLYRVQIGAFVKKGNADSLAVEIEKKGMSTYIAHDTDDDLYRVQVGAFSNKSNAENQLKQLRNAGFKDAFIASNDGYTMPKSDEDVTESPTDTPRLIGEWQTNQYGTQWIKAEGTFTVGSEPITLRNGSPVQSAPSPGKAQPGANIKYHEMIRVKFSETEGYIGVGYFTGEGGLRYCYTGVWDPVTGAVTEEWGAYS